MAKRSPSDRMQKLLDELQAFADAEAKNRAAANNPMFFSTSIPINKGQLLQQVHPGSIAPIGQPLGGMTWNCEACSKTIPDSETDVTSVNVTLPTGSMMTRNFRHCKHDLKCIATARQECEDFKTNAQLNAAHGFGGGGGSPGGSGHWYIGSQGV